MVYILQGIYDVQPEAKLLEPQTLNEHANAHCRVLNIAFQREEAVQWEDDWAQIQILHVFIYLKLKQRV